MRQVTDHIILSLATLFMTVPLLLVLAGAFSSGGLSGWLRGHFPSLSGVVDNSAALGRMLGNGTSGPTLGEMVFTSLFAASLVAALTTISAFLAAYALTFVLRRGERALLFLFLLTLFFPVEVRMLPTFEVADRLGLINTMAGLVLPVLPVAMATFILRQHMRQLPGELLEAARLDGAGPVRFMVDFVVPLSFAPLGAVLVITFLVGWNQYLWPLMISVDNSLFPLMRGLSLAGTGSGPSMVIAATSVLPPLLLILAFLRLLSRVTAIRI